VAFVAKLVSAGRAASQVTSHLVQLASRPQIIVAARAPDDLLGHALDLLSNAFDFLLGRLAVERRHLVPSSGARKTRSIPDNSLNPFSRLNCQET